MSHGNVRATDARLRRLIDGGLAASPTLRAMFEQLSASDVIVYVRCEPLPAQTEGRLTFMSSAGGWRYLDVRLASRLSSFERLAVLGHELQHALEIAADPTIVSESSLRLAYRHTGFARRTRGPLPAYDTRAAIEAGERVWLELAAVNSPVY